MLVYSEWSWTVLEIVVILWNSNSNISVTKEEWKEVCTIKIGAYEMFNNIPIILNGNK